ncbi:MAG: YgeY family selenium metabolism-linked hydrolase [Firmicutes bacterium]|nr:YgeY family selenium metabolism-linked hydrolase [Bacillota bacterium]
MITGNIVARVRELSGILEPDLVRFVRDLVRTPSPSGNERAVAELVAAEMKSSGFDEVYVDKLGSVLGKIGSGPVKILYDAHMDTVEAMDPGSWSHPPLAAEVENGIIYGLGAVDDKGSLGAMVKAGAGLKSLGVSEQVTLYVAGAVGEENCEGLATGRLLQETGIRPDYVLVAESSELQVKRGHKGRATIIVTVPGKAVHASTPELGDNPLYKAGRFIETLSTMGPSLMYHDFLGRGTIAATRVECVAASINTVPELCRVYIDRRLTAGEDRERILSELGSIVPPGSTVEIMRFEGSAYTGARIVADEYFPSWFLPEDHELVRAGSRAAAALGLSPGVGRWAFSTDAAYTMGVAGIPTIGMGPGNPKHCHSKEDQVGVDELVRANQFYTLLPLAVAGLLE